MKFFLIEGNLFIENKPFIEDKELNIIRLQHNLQCETKNQNFQSKP